MKRLTAIVFLCGVVNFLTSCSMPEQTHDSIPWQIYAEPGQTSGKLLPGLGDKYVGDLLFGKMHGHGTYTYSGGEKYVGTFANGLMSGKGTFTWPNRDKYVGEFANGVMDGKGTFTKRGFGEKTVGEWKNGRGWNVTIYKRDGTVSGTVYKGVFTSGPCWTGFLSKECRPRRCRLVEQDFGFPDKYCD